MVTGTATHDDFWLATLSGGEIDLLDPSPAQFDMGEIAEALSKICRFSGRISAIWSVAQHSVLMADHATPAARPYCLLHDAKESGIGDTPTPAKRAQLVALAGLDMPTADPREERMRRALHGLLVERQRAFEDRIDAAIHRAAGLSWPPPRDVAAEVHALDLRALVTERRRFMAPTRRKWGAAVEKARPFYRARLDPLAPPLAAAEWLAAARDCLPVFAALRADAA